MQQRFKNQEASYFLQHIWAHSGLPGPLGEVSQIVGLASHCLTQMVPEFVWFKQATASHALHQLSAMLWCQFQPCREQAQQTVTDCSACVTSLPVPWYGVNPWDLLPSAFELMVGWMEAVKHCITYCLLTFSVAGLPKMLKTDNAPVHTSVVLNFVPPWELHIKQVSLTICKHKGHGSIKVLLKK